MNGDVSVTFDSLVRAAGCLTANDAALPEVNRSAARKTLDSAITGLQGQMTAQQVAKEQELGGTNKHTALKKTLRGQMHVVSSIAVHNPTGIEELRTLRSSPANASLNVMVTKANAMADAVTTHPDVFAAGGLPADFLTSFRATIQAVQAQVATRNAIENTRVASTQKSVELGRQGRRAIQVLNSLVRLHAVGDPTLLAAWNSAKRLRGVRTVATVPAAASAATSIATPAAATSAATPALATGAPKEVTGTAA
jgi:hypothetical protein